MDEVRTFSEGGMDITIPINIVNKSYSCCLFIDLGGLKARLKLGQCGLT